LLGLLPFVHPSLKVVAETERVIHETARVLAWLRLLYLRDPCEQWQVYYLALCDALRPEEFLDACRRLAIPGRVMNRVFAGRRHALSMLDAIQRRLKRGPEIRRSEIYTWFHGLPLEMLLYLAAKAVRDEVRRFVSLFLTQLRQVRPSLDGTALQELGLTAGPRFRGVMERLLAARLDGEVLTDDDERVLAIRLIMSNNHTPVS